MQELRQSVYRCPICGFGLSSPADDFTICPSCGIEFGYSDAGSSHAELRREWIDFGTPWTSKVIPKPAGWNAWTQLINAGFAADIPYLSQVKITQPTAYVPVKFFGASAVPSGALITSMGMGAA